MDGGTDIGIDLGAGYDAVPESSGRIEKEAVGLVGAAETRAGAASVDAGAVGTFSVRLGADAVGAGVVGAGAVGAGAVGALSVRCGADAVAFGKLGAFSASSRAGDACGASASARAGFNSADSTDEVADTPDMLLVSPSEGAAIPINVPDVFR